MKCLQCNKVFAPKRKTAKFCSDACRRDYNRTKVEDKDKGGTENNLPEKNTEVKTKAPVSKHPSIKPPKPDYMTDYDYSRWDGVECKWGPCLDKNCKWRD